MIHQKEGDKIYTYQNTKDFSLDKVTDLIHRDVSRAALLKKNGNFIDLDFDKVKLKID